MKKRFPYSKTFILGFGFLGINVIWPIFNNYVPIFLKEDFGLSAAMIGFVMTWDNYLNMFVQPQVGDRSDRTRTRIGRRKPFMLVGAPLAALFFLAVPLARSVPFIMLALLLTNLSMALFRAPTVAGPQAVGILIDVTTENYRIMFLFAAIFMALAGFFMSRVKEKRETGLESESPAGA